MGRSLVRAQGGFALVSGVFRVTDAFDCVSSLALFARQVLLFECQVVRIGTKRLLTRVRLKNSCDPVKGIAI